MFTGIVETTARVVNIEKDKTNIHFTLEVPFVEELTIDQSMAHDGCCLTVVSLDKTKNQYVVTAMIETLEKTNLRTWEIGSEVNVERSMPMNGRFDGHIVQGHVDQTAECVEVIDEDGSWRYFFQYDIASGFMTVPKGSITINGVSLTVVDSEKGKLSVAIIPYTHEHTNFHNIRKGTVVNLEFDILGKYIQQMLAQYLADRKSE